MKYVTDISIWFHEAVLYMGYLNMAELYIIYLFTSVTHVKHKYIIYLNINYFN